MAIQDSGSNYQFYDKKIKPNVKRSSFQLDYLSTFTARQGFLIPYRVQETLPNSEYNLSLECLSRAVNVPKVILQSRQRIFFHEYFVTYQQMWPEWSVFMSKGVSGKVTKLLPRIRFCFSGHYVRKMLESFNINNAHELATKWNPFLANKLLNEFGLGFGSLADYLGFPTPVAAIRKLDEFIQALKGDWNVYILPQNSPRYFVDFDAFPFFAYFSVFRNFYLSWNLNSENKNFFPDNVNDFALVNPDLPAENVWFSCLRAGLSYDYNTFSSMDKVSPIAREQLGLIKHRNFVDDYFTAALPWPMRGNIPQLSIDGKVNLPDVPVGIRPSSSDDFVPLEIHGNVKHGDFYEFSTGFNFTSGENLLLTGGMEAANTTSGSLYSSRGVQIPSSFVDGERSFPLSARGQVDASFVSGFTWEMIRNLSTATIIAEKMARTNGSYKEFIQTFFDDVPSNQINNVPRYIGGNVQPIVYTEVLQTSSDANTPLGTPGAKGISSSDGYIGKVYSNDFGVIVGILSIMPDTYYSQGLRRQNLYQVQEDFYLPERAELGMQGILKGELFFSGNEQQDGSLFGYQNRYDEWRYRANEIHGEVANPSNKSYFPYTQSRYFTGAPVLGNEFVSTKDNIRRDYLTSLDEVDFMVQVANKCTAVQPLPYRAVPVGLK